MEIDFNALGTFGNNPENRLKIIQGVSSEVPMLGGLRSTVPAAEMLVQTIEKLASDPAVRHDMAARVSFEAVSSVITHRASPQL